MIKHKVLGEIKVPKFHFEDMWKLVREAIEKLPKELREDKRRKVYLFVGENEEGTKTVTLTLYDKGYCLEGFYTARGFASDDDPARKAGEQCAAQGITSMKMYLL